LREKNEAPCDDAASDFECGRTRSITKALSAGGEPFSYFRTSGLCVICNYVLHTLEYCTSSARRILMFRLSHFQKTESKFGGINSNGLTNELSSSFLFSRKIHSFSYLVPPYHKYLGSTYEKPLFKMKIDQFQGGSGLVSQLKQGCASPDQGRAFSLCW